MLPKVSQPRYAVFSDFDESLLAKTSTPQSTHDLYCLKDWLERRVVAHDILFCIVTGSNFASMINKLEANPARFLPHVAGTSMGTTLHCIDADGWRIDEAYARSFCTHEQFVSAVETVLAALANKGIQLQRQSESNQDRYKQSYYFMQVGERLQVSFMSRIRSLAKAHGLSVNCSHCNPAAGDPAGALDVDLLPAGAGKAAVVNFVLDQHGIPTERAWAFGDSGNDVAMLKSVGHGYCLANGTSELKQSTPHHTTQPYAGGILELLKRTFG